MIAEGAVLVRLLISGERVARAEVSVRRPQAARALAGRPLAEAVRLVPALFSLCGTAQAVAALTACEAASGLDSPAHAAAHAAAHTAARTLLVRAEMASIHGWQAVVDWPRLLGEVPSPAALIPVRTAIAALGKLLYPAGDGLRLDAAPPTAEPQAVRQAAAPIIEWFGREVFGGPIPADAWSLADWAETGTTPAARLANRLMAPEIAGFGSSPVPPLSAQDAGWFAARLAANPGFAAAPATEAGPAFTGPLARRMDHPLVAPLVALHGTGLAAHMAARIADMAELCRSLGDADGKGAVDGRGGAGSGCGVVETARGRLAHWVRLTGDGRVADYRIVAPTEWNFAADGALARGLTGAADGRDLEERARLLVAQLDPCVPSTITIDAEGAPDA